MQPLREAQVAKHFRMALDGKWTPCDRNDEGSEEKTLFQIPAARLSLRTIAKVFATHVTSSRLSC